MSDPDKRRHPAPAKRRAVPPAEAREARLATALRENLRKRKQQARARSDKPPSTPPEDPRG